MDLELTSFLQRVNDVYGLYRDAIMAFSMLASDTENKLKQIPPNIDLTKLRFGYAEKSEEMLGGAARHTSMTDDYIQRNKVGGANHVFIANFCIVLIYAYWEFHREQIKIKTGEVIQSDLMGDIKDVRHAIIHKNGVLHKNLKVLEFLKNDSSIRIGKEFFDKIIDLIKAEMESINIKKQELTRNAGVH